MVPSDDEQKDLFQLANKVPFDDRVNHHAEMTDLNITLVQSYLKEVNSTLFDKLKTEDFVNICQDMNLVSVMPEYVKPKNIGLMFFSLEPEKFFPYAQIDVVQFPKGLGGDDIIEQTFKGPIQQQLRDALRYIRNTIITEKVIKYPNRAEANGSPKPEFETDDERTYFIARMFIQPEFQEEIEDGEKTTPKTTPKINGLEQEELQDKIINCIIENPNISKKAMEELLGITKYEVKKQINILKELERIKYVGPSKGGIWVVLE